MSALKVRPSSFLVFFLVYSIPLFAQTLRQDAEQRFTAVDWAEGGDMVTATELPGKNITGGNETFPVMVPASSSDASSIYPSFRGLGILDYTTMGDNLLAAARSLSDSLLEGSVDSSHYSLNRAWLPVLTNYRLKELPKPDFVRFSRSDDANPDEPVIRYFAGNAERTSYRTYSVTFMRESSSWVVWDFQFSGETDGTGAYQD